MSFQGSEPAFVRKAECLDLPTRRARSLKIGGLLLVVAGWLLALSCGAPSRNQLPEEISATVQTLPRSVEAGGYAGWRVTTTITTGALLPGGSIALFVPQGFSVSRFFYDQPQALSPLEPGFVTVHTDSAAQLIALPGPWRSVEAKVVIGTIEAGGKVWFQFEPGVETPGTRCPPNAEAPFHFVLAVDSDGDGKYGLIRHDSVAQIRPAALAKISVIGRSTVLVGASTSLLLRLEDEYGNRVSRGDYGVSLEADGMEEAPSSRWTVSEQAEACRRVTVVFRTPGCHIVKARVHPEGIIGVSNPIMVAIEQPQKSLVWADLHGHSGYSDGLGDPDDYYHYARNVSGLEVAALTDHAELLTPSEWEQIKTITESYNEAGAFVTILGFEESSEGINHYDVYLFESAKATGIALGRPLAGLPDAWYLRELNGPSEEQIVATTAQVLEQYQTDTYLTVRHSTAHESMGTDWRPNLTQERLIEIYSCWGSNDDAACPLRVPGFRPEGSVLHRLDEGHVLGFIAAGDSHDARPGNSQFGHQPGGLTGLWVTELTRSGIYEALRNRACYATAGERVIMLLTVNGAEMGSEVASRELDEVRFQVYAAHYPIGLTLYHNRSVVWATEQYANGQELTITAPGLAGSYYYLKARRGREPIAWTSPVFTQ